MLKKPLLTEIDTEKNKSQPKIVLRLNTDNQNIEKGEKGEKIKGNSRQNSNNSPSPSNISNVNDLSNLNPNKKPFKRNIVIDKPKFNLNFNKNKVNNNNSNILPGIK